MHSWKNAILICVLIVAGLLPAGAQNRHLQSFNSEVPFEFKIGDRKFHAGYYEFVVLGPGIMAMRDRRAHVLAMLMTRQLQGQERDVAPRFIFQNSKGHMRLSSIWNAKGAEGYEILGEDMPVHTAQQEIGPILLKIPLAPHPQSNAMK